MHWPRIRGLCSVSWCLAEGQWNGDQRRPMGRKAREVLYSLSLSLSPDIIEVHLASGLMPMHLKADHRPVRCHHAELILLDSLAMFC